MPEVATTPEACDHEVWQCVDCRAGLDDVSGGHQAEARHRFRCVDCDLVPDMAAFYARSGVTWQPGTCQQA